MIPTPNMKKYTQESIDYIKSAFETLDFEDHQLDDDGLPISISSKLKASFISFLVGDNSCTF